MPGARIASGERVTLRTAETEDVPFLQRAHANPELRHMLGWGVKNQLQLEDDLKDDLGHDELFVVCLDDEEAGHPEGDDTRRIGAIVAGSNEHARTGIGFWLVPSVHGEGYGAEAISLALDHLFHDFPAPAIYASVLPDNGAARGLLESLGFVQEGRSRKAAFWGGEYRDAIEYSLLREEWRVRD